MKFSWENSISNQSLFSQLQLKIKTTSKFGLVADERTCRVTLVKTAGGAGRQDDNKQQQLQHGQQPQQGLGSGAERSAGGHLRWRRAGVLSGTPLRRRPRGPQGASVQTNYTTKAHGVDYQTLHEVSGGPVRRRSGVSSCLLHLPQALYSGVLHD